MMSKISQIKQRLRERYHLPKYALFFEVNDKIGTDSARRADAIAVGLDRKASCLVTGFEIKVSRSDWLRELKQPEKSTCFAAQCNEFYIVATSEVVHAEEIPEGYGWIDPLRHRIQKPAILHLQRIPSVDLMLVLLRSTAMTCEKYEKIRGVVESSLYEFLDAEKKEKMECQN